MNRPTDRAPARTSNIHDARADPHGDARVRARETYRLLDDDGRWIGPVGADLPFPHGVIEDMYCWMVLARAVDREAVMLQRQGQLALYSECYGQEAAQVASASSLRAGDWIFPTYRELAAAMVRGLDPVDVLHLYRGTWLSHHDPQALGVAPMTIPIATQALHAVGWAMGAGLAGSESVCIAYLGDGATSEGDAHEAFNFAAVFGAPCVFFVQNNQYAISVPTRHQMRGPSIADRAIGYGMPGVRVDGNDVMATHEVCLRAVERARAGEGPTLIEAVTYRLGAHTTSDDPSRYRSQQEVDDALRRDPISRMEVFLRSRGLWSDDMAERLASRCADLVSHVRSEIVDAPVGEATELFDHVYVESFDRLEGQRAQMLREVSRTSNGDDVQRPGQ